MDPQSQNNYPIDLCNVISGVVQSASEVSQADGNLIKPSTDVLQAAEQTLNQLANDKSQFDGSGINHALGQLAVQLEKVSAVFSVLGDFYLKIH